jgi:hypothetical protein
MSAARIGRDSKGDLAEIAHAGRTPAFLTGGRQRRQEQRRKDGDYGNDDQ